MKKAVHIHKPLQKILDSIDEQIAYHKQRIVQLEFNREVYMEYKPYLVDISKPPPALTRELIRDFLKDYRYPVQTVQTIMILYPTKSDEEKSKLVKTLSVIFNQMEKDGEITIEKKKGIKGNFYRYIKK